MFQISHIAKSYHHHPVLTDISFEAAPGECIGLIGPNGSGKSTLLQIVSGMIRPDSGQIFWDEKNLSETPQLFSRLIAYVPQTNPLFEDMSALDHLKLWYSGTEASLSDDLEKGFPARLGIGAFLGKKVSALSGGMKKRLSLACALAAGPPLVLLDEPAAALDLVGKEEIRTYIQELKQMGKTILLATHEEEDFALCSRLLLLFDGSARELPANTPARVIVDMLGNLQKENPGIEKNTME